MLKKCSKCNSDKTFLRLRKYKVKTGYKESPEFYCKTCRNESNRLWYLSNPRQAAKINRDKRLKFKYNMSSQNYEDMCIQQNYKCLICDKQKKLVVDHCHKTGRIRGLLCYSCNTLLGHIENKNKMERISVYLNDKKENKVQK